MKVKFNLWGQLKQAAQTDKIELDVDENSTMEDVFKKLALSGNEELQKIIMTGDRINPTVLVFIDDEQVETGSDQKLDEDTEISLMSPMAGG